MRQDGTTLGRTGLLLAVLQAAACLAPDVFECTASSDCDRSAAGRCEVDLRCSYPDELCAGGRRYSQSAGDRAGACLTAEGGGQSDASSADAAPVNGPDGGATLVTIGPEADAYVRDGVNADVNFGGEYRLVVKLNDDPFFVRETFLRFDLTGLPSGVVEAATLKLALLTVNAAATHELSFVADDAWSEGAITFASKPAAGAALGSWEVTASLAPEIEIAAVVQSAIDGDRHLSLAIRSLTGAPMGVDDFADYSAREGPSPPVLSIALR